MNSELHDQSADMSNDQSEKDNSLEKMRVSADMSNMVEDITYVVDGFNNSIKLLYLTNRQATLINTNEIMNSLLDQLNIRNPNFLFIFETALSVNHIKLCIKPTGKTSKYEKFESEFCERDFTLTRKQLIDFMSQVVIPIAKNTNAVVLLSEGSTCFFNEAMEKALGFFALRDTVQRPFTIVQISSMYSIYHKYTEKKSVAYKILSESNIFKSRIELIKNSGVDQHWMRFSKPADLSINSARIIIVESIDQTLESICKVDKNTLCTDEDLAYVYGPKYSLYKLLINCISKGVPSLAIGSFDTPHEFLIFVEHLDRNIPVLLLDSRERVFSSNKLTATATEYAKTLDTFPSISEEDAKKLLALENGTMTPEGRLLLVNYACDIVKNTYNKKEHTLFCEYVVSLMAFFECVLNIGQLIQVKAEQIGTNQNGRQLSAGSKPVDIAVDAVATFLALDRVALKKNAWGPQTLIAEDYINVSEFYYDMDENVAFRYSYFLRLFTSHRNFAGSLFDIPDLHNQVQRIVRHGTQSDMAPTEESLETIRDALSFAKECGDYAFIYKWICKISFMLLLVSGIVITVVNLITDILGPSITTWTIMALSFSATAIASVISHVNPVVKWEQLRLGECAIKSEIWKFRTCTGVYRPSDDKFTVDRKPEKVLAACLTALKTQVVEEAHMKDTSFYGLETRWQIIRMFVNCICNYRKETREDDPLCDDLESSNKNKILQRKVSNQTTGAARWNDFDRWRKKNNGVKTTSDNNTSYMAPNPSADSALEHKSDDNAQHDLELHALFSPENPIPESVMVHIQGTGGGDNGRPSSSPTVINLSEIVAFIKSENREVERVEDEKKKDDEYHSFVTTKNYLTWRLETTKQFYQKRIPRYIWLRDTAEYLVIAGLIVSGVLAYAGRSQWATLITITIASIRAYIEFQSTAAKIYRYSTVVSALRDLNLEWNSRPLHEQLNAKNIDDLVTNCERVIMNETRSWQTTSQVGKLINSKISTKIAGDSTIPAMSSKSAT